MNRHLSVGLVAALLSLSAGYFIGQQGQSETDSVLSRTADASARLMELTLPDAAGAPHALGRWKGKVIVLNFWATWCPPCREEMPEFSRLQGKYAGSGVQFVGISLDSATNVQLFVDKSPVSYPLLIALEEGVELSRLFGNSSAGLPYTVLLDREGKVRFTRLGRVFEHELDALLQKITN